MRENRPKTEVYTLSDLTLGYGLVSLTPPAYVGGTFKVYLRPMPYQAVFLHQAHFN